VSTRSSKSSRAKPMNVNLQSAGGLGYEPFKDPLAGQPPPEDPQAQHFAQTMENLEKRKDDLTPASRARLDEITERAKETTDEEVDEVMHVESPRSNNANAAAALAKFREASGLRKATEAIVQFINDEPPPNTLLHLRWRIAKVTESLPSRVFFISLVCINALLMWVQADTDGDPDMWMAIEATFVTLFTVEVALKLFGFGLIFFSEPWNSLDFFIVLSSILEITAAALSGSSGGSSISTIRLLRVFRIIRMMSILDRLNMLVRAFFHACKDVVWVLALLLIVLYIFAVMARGLFGKGGELRSSSFDQEGHFGTVPLTMVTMFQIMTLDSWASTIVRPVGEVYPGSQLFFLVFVLIGSLGLLNLLTAIFIDSLNTLNKEGAIEEEQRKDDNRKLLLAALTQVFQECDEDKSGELDRDEMQVAMHRFHDPVYQEAFASVGLDLQMMEGMLRHADSDMSGKIDFLEFTEGIKNMEGAPVKADIWALQGKLNHITNEVLTGQDNLLKQVLQGQQDLRTDMVAMNAKVDKLMAHIMM